MEGFRYIIGGIFITASWWTIAIYLSFAISSLANRLRIKQNIREVCFKIFAVVAIIIWIVLLALFFHESILESINSFLISPAYDKLFIFLTIITVFKFFVQEVKNSSPDKAIIISCVKFLGLYIAVPFIIIILTYLMGSYFSDLIKTYNLYNKVSQSNGSLIYVLVCIVTINAIIIRKTTKWLIPGDKPDEKLKWLIVIVTLWIPVLFGKPGIPIIGIEYITNNDFAKMFTNKELIWMFALVLVAYIDAVPRFIHDSIKGIYRKYLPSSPNDLEL